MTTPTIRFRKPPATAITSSTRSTATSLSTSLSASNWPATSWLAQGVAGNYAESVVATGFLALSRRYATAPFELWHLTLEDTIETTGRAFLGLTLRCARCHDHKFDPVSQRDYYALYGIFASTTFPYAGSEELQSKAFPRLNFVPLVEPGRAEPKLKAYRDRLEKLEGTIKSLEPKKDPSSVRRLNDLRKELIVLKRPSLPPDLAGRLRRHRGEAGRRRASAAGRSRQSGRSRPARGPSVRIPGRRAAACCFVAGQRTARAGTLADAARAIP